MFIILTKSSYNIGGEKYIISYYFFSLEFFIIRISLELFFIIYIFLIK